MLDGKPIVARATPPGEGAIAIVRMSGSDLFSIADSCFKPANGSLFSDSSERTLIYGQFYDDNRLVDRCLAVRFIAPASFSGEDMVEFHVHGNPLIVDAVTRTCLRHGCRLAEPGEFSRRAFVNGKMDLAQAEGLSEVIRAESESMLDLAQRQLGGELSRRFNNYRRQLVDVLALLELELDFVQEGYQLLDLDDLQVTLKQLSDEADALLDTYRSADHLRRGPRILLLGKANAGKSSLFNAFLGYSRALVSDTPGTTRDYLGERILFNGVILHFLDSAGLRETTDRLEAQGVGLAQRLVPLVDKVLYLIDSSLPSSHIESELSSVQALSSEYPAVSFIPLFSKSDLSKGVGDRFSCSIHDRDSVIAVLDKLVQEYSVSLSSQLALLSERQLALLRSMKESLNAITICSDLSTEFLSSDLRTLLQPLSELTGDLTNEDILDALFSGFCIGK
ncbi:MAG: tRNA uridine-5-carboxymethylaminomethyl(34) synthesis GTPase MnmE [Chlorobi bacterium]|nr:tRNA uridine-5-carboxymethylaminomethyl(34) synthesis GTPase MnmE [Chlorobiota bacterium]